MRKTKILHIIKSLGRGGAEMLLPETLKQHHQDQFEFHYIYFLPWKNQLVETIEKAGGKVSCFSAKNNIQLLLQYPKIIRYCKENQIQLIHAHLPWAGFVSRLVHQLTKIPVIYTEHNLQERYHFITKTINKWSFNSQTLGIGVSEDVTQSILKNIKPIIPCKTILNGVNTQSFVRLNGAERETIRKQFSIPEDSLLVGTVAVFRFQKRLDKWLEIMKECMEKNPNVYGIIIGAGPLENELKAKHKELNLEGKVFFAGLQTQVKPYYEAMDIFMMCSSFEGLPIALLEAMSMSCAIVSTNAGGIKEVLRHEVDGLMVDVDDWEQLPYSILELAENPSKLNHLQVQARKRAEAAFSIDAMVTELESLYLSHIS
ncbi:glycosyltransferase family 4 protein [Flavobacterium psychrotolerans]|uniref:Glycosyl transferase family 1 n=1 Tax=Flavobacterium psychrotolerans TaxID=2169410 RepID=A0A2U1JFW1_9FLAO|nr:glycosyltransferase family 4 protein [Flavobacterium psychrotolerans]PWA04020.1 glycosyl transferase family 1 [Flavobacterium psychrotolerans]